MDKFRVTAEDVAGELGVSCSRIFEVGLGGLGPAMRPFGILDLYSPNP